MISLYKNIANKAWRVLFCTMALCTLALSTGLSMAANTHDAVLGHSLSNVNIVTAPKQAQNKRKTNKHRRAILRAGKRRKTGSVKARRLDIDSVNTLGGSISSGRGAAVAIGAADLSRIRADEVQVQTTNTIDQGVNAKGDETRFRMGTVDASGLDTGRLNISTENTIEGSVSVKDGQDVSIGVVEMGNVRNEQKKSPKHGTKNGPDNTEEIGFRKIGNYGTAVDLTEAVTNQANKDEANDDPNGMCQRVCINDKDCCDPAGGLQGECHVIDGCSAVADTLRGNIFGKPGGPVYSNTRGHIPCNSHDQCYQTCGTNKLACDMQLYYDMVNECRRNHEFFDGQAELSPSKLKEKAAAAKDGLSKIIDDVKDALKDGAITTTIIVIGSAVETGGVSVVPALPAGGEETLRSFIKNAALHSATDPNYRYTGKEIIIVPPLMLEGFITTRSYKLDNLRKKYHEQSGEFINSIKKSSNTANKTIDNASNKAGTLIYDVADSIETMGDFTENFTGKYAKSIEPESSFVDAITVEQTNSCQVDSHFYTYMRCKASHVPEDIMDGGKSIASGLSWATKKSGSFFLRNNGKIANVASQLVAGDVRFYGAVGIEAVKTTAKAIVNIKRNVGVAYVLLTDRVVDKSTSLIKSKLDMVAKDINIRRSLTYDCLSTAETYFVGVQVFGKNSFRGNNTPCSTNKIVSEDDKCCVVNPSYQYHVPELMDNQQNIYPSPYDMCHHQ